MNKVELLKKLGEETIYSAKGHFKACDLRRNCITITIWLCAIVNVLGILGFNGIIGKGTSVIGLLGTISLLLWNEGEGKNYRVKHKEYGEKYLSVHKKIRECYFLEESSIDEVKELSNHVREIDREVKPDIPRIAYKLSKKAIEKTGETDNWFNR